MRKSVLWYGMIVYGIVCYPFVCNAIVWYSIVWYNGIDCSPFVCNAIVWYGIAWYNSIWYGMVWYGIIVYSMVTRVPLPASSHSFLLLPLYLYHPTLLELTLLLKFYFSLPLSTSCCFSLGAVHK